MHGLLLPEFQPWHDPLIPTLETYKKHHINLNWEDDSIARIGDVVAHRGAARQDWYLYKGAIRHDLALYRRVYGVSWEEASRYFGE